MKVCVVGSGGREHALAHVLARTAEVVVTPGNPGMADPITFVDDLQGLPEDSIKKVMGGNLNRLMGFDTAA